ncbi:dihydrolipoamide acetyltransferase component of pyruvate dehydrogenase complex [Iodidimonas gelatinilytica]|uniref:Dihydrolipoamide acetyltransferase component of pyruvate dehydrogenase complex n=1 Tax=Iodidimonas gelatinilytica TaxID=1236966 RepID=A0A5A7MVT3_9PROT|nr:dihydrolipoamide acetyltransferase family protein [Iodidimonas gelatinilytica]GER00131.1 dihydrolipoamide acetyltransferase component of pyruvate dehydrogenase complex [Iodidimonas gelatinilytica]
MRQDFRLQDPGEGIHEVEVQDILVKPGDAVEDGDTAFVVESDKAAIELPSPYHGTVVDIPVKVGDIVRVGDVLMTVETDEKAVSSKGETAPDAPSIKQENEAGPSAQKGGDAPAHTGPIKAAPTARRLAKERHISLADIRPTGSKGHITRADVEAYEKGTQIKAGQGSITASPLPDFSQFGPVRRTALQSIRKATARHMAKAWAEIPHVMLEERIDLTGLERRRKLHAMALAEKGGPPLTLLPFVVKAVTIALKQHPRFNASLDMVREEIVEKDYIHMGIAMDSDRGLLVPVLRDADRLGIVELAAALKELSERVRAGKAGPADLKGGTFSITNMGALGGTGFFPIINYPESAILGMGRGKIEPVIIGDLDHYHVEARFIVPFSLSFDHRLNDGADAARFLSTVRSVLTDPDAMALTM